MKNSIWYSRLLVAAQMGLIALILMPVRELFSGELSLVAIIGLCCIMVAIALALWALTTMRLNNFSIMPEPKPEATLVIAGPYQYIRHPMYSAVLLASAGACLIHLQAINYFFLTLLLLVLLMKIRREESLLNLKFDSYERYQRHTSVIIPSVF